VIAGNHPSVLDGILLWAVSPRPIRYLIAEDLYRHRFLHPIFSAFGCIEVYRTKNRNGDALHAAVAALEQGEVIGIFPEGTIHSGGVVREIKQGVALLALRTGVPVIPLAIHGSREAFPPFARTPRPHPVELDFGEPVAYPKTSGARIPDKVVAGAREAIRQRILDVMRMTAPGRSMMRLGVAGYARQVAAGAIIRPLCRFLTATAQPSLDPVAKA
jgi:1-acyl-sn-glycerol-3-phosphate acyltransferase